MDLVTIVLLLVAVLWGLEKLGRLMESIRPTYARVVAAVDNFAHISERVARWAGVAERMAVSTQATANALVDRTQAAAGAVVRPVVGTTTTVAQSVRSSFVDHPVICGATVASLLLVSPTLYRRCKAWWKEDGTRPEGPFSSAKEAARLADYVTFVAGISGLALSLGAGVANQSASEGLAALSRAASSRLLTFFTLLIRSTGRVFERNRFTGAQAIENGQSRRIAYDVAMPEDTWVLWRQDLLRTFTAAPYHDCEQYRVLERVVQQLEGNEPAVASLLRDRGAAYVAHCVDNRLAITPAQQLFFTTLHHHAFWTYPEGVESGDVLAAQMINEEAGRVEPSPAMLIAGPVLGQFARHRNAVVGTAVAAGLVIGSLALARRLYNTRNVSLKRAAELLEPEMEDGTAIPEGVRGHMKVAVNRAGRETRDVMKNHGGKITWIQYDLEVDLVNQFRDRAEDLRRERDELRKEIAKWEDELERGTYHEAENVRRAYVRAAMMDRAIQAEEQGYRWTILKRDQLRGGEKAFKVAARPRPVQLPSVRDDPVSRELRRLERRDGAAATFDGEAVGEGVRDWLDILWKKETAEELKNRRLAAEHIEPVGAEPVKYMPLAAFVVSDFTTTAPAAPEAPAPPPVPVATVAVVPPVAAVAEAPAPMKATEKLPAMVRMCQYNNGTARCGRRVSDKAPAAAVLCPMHWAQAARVVVAKPSKTSQEAKPEAPSMTSAKTAADNSFTRRLFRNSRWIGAVTCTTIGQACTGHQLIVGGTQKQFEALIGQEVGQIEVRGANGVTKLVGAVMTKYIPDRDLVLMKVKNLQDLGVSGKLHNGVLPEKGGCAIHCAGAEGRPEVATGVIGAQMENNLGHVYAHSCTTDFGDSGSAMVHATNAVAAGSQRIIGVHSGSSGAVAMSDVVNFFVPLTAADFQLSPAKPEESRPATTDSTGPVATTTTTASV